MTTLLFVEVENSERIFTNITYDAILTCCYPDSPRVFCSPFTKLYAYIVDKSFVPFVEVDTVFFSLLN